MYLREHEITDEQMEWDNVLEGQGQTKSFTCPGYVNLIQFRSATEWDWKHF